MRRSRPRLRFLVIAGALAVAAAGVPVASAMAQTGPFNLVLTEMHFPHGDRSKVWVRADNHSDRAGRVTKVVCTTRRFGPSTGAKIGVGMNATDHTRTMPDGGHHLDPGAWVGWEFQFSGALRFTDNVTCTFHAVDDSGRPEANTADNTRGLAEPTIGRIRDVITG